MKKLFLFLTLFFSCEMFMFSQGMESDYLSVYLLDHDGDVTNIRATPSGKVIQTLSNKEDYTITVCEFQNKWWYICRPIECVEGNPIVLPETGGWIHSSVLCVSSRNYGGEKLSLRKTPDDKAEIVYSFSNETQFRPLERKGLWVKVMTIDKKYQGWIEASWLCGNPVTNCN